MLHKYLDMNLDRSLDSHFHRNFDMNLDNLGMTIHKKSYRSAHKALDKQPHSLLDKISHKLIDMIADKYLDNLLHIPLDMSIHKYSGNMSGNNHNLHIHHNPMLLQKLEDIHLHLHNL